MGHCSFPRLDPKRKHGKGELRMNRMFSLNDVSTEFAVEELEPRLEMQMLGVGTDPGIIFFPSATVIIIFTSTRYITII